MTEEKERSVQVAAQTKKSSSKSSTPAISESSGSLPMKSKVTENDFKDPKVRALAIASKTYMRFEIAINDAFPLLTLPNLRSDLIWKVIDATATKIPSLRPALNQVKKDSLLEDIVSKFVMFSFSPALKFLNCFLGLVWSKWPSEFSRQQSEGAHRCWVWHSWQVRER
jgi:hypothetical protein